MAAEPHVSIRLSPSPKNRDMVEMVHGRVHICCFFVEHNRVRALLCSVSQTFKEARIQRKRLQRRANLRAMDAVPR